MLNVNELEESEGQLVDPCVRIQDVFATMQAMPRLFKILTNFTLVEFDELITLVSILVSHE
jgi:hypothetical protein